VLSSQTPLKKSDLEESCKDDRRYPCSLDARGIENIRHNEDRELEEGNDEVNIGYQGSPYVCALSEIFMGISPRGVISWISCGCADSFGRRALKSWWQERHEIGSRGLQQRTTQYVAASS
jgi:hypothetical protein